MLVELVGGFFLCEGVFGKGLGLRFWLGFYRLVFFRWLVCWW